MISQEDRLPLGLIRHFPEDREGSFELVCLRKSRGSWVADSAGLLDCRAARAVAVFYGAR